MYLVCAARVVEKFGREICPPFRGGAGGEKKKLTATTLESKKACMVTSTQRNRTHSNTYRFPVSAYVMSFGVTFPRLRLASSRVFFFFFCMYVRLARCYHIYGRVDL